MGCDRTEATLLWLYGEGDPAQVDHVAGCVSCSEVAAEHADVVGAIGVVLPALQQAPSPRGSRGIAPRRRVLRWAALAAATVGISTLGATGIPRSPGIPAGEALPAVVPVAEVVFAPDADPFDVALDAMDLELDSLSRDLEML